MTSTTNDTSQPNGIPKGEEGSRPLAEISTYEHIPDAELSDDGSETSLVGYISIRDFAYEESNPLHYGYYDDGAEETEDITDVGGYPGDDSYTNEYEGGEEDGKEPLERRQSVILPNEYIVNKRAVALYSFQPENDNELGFDEGDTLFISYRHGQGWLVAENQERNKTGLVPEEFVSFVEPSQEDEDEDNTLARPFYLTQFITNGLCPSQDDTEGEDNVVDNDEDWEDIDYLESDLKKNLTLQEQKIGN
ncbi:similar to Saccharomyces cerevisiae YDR162C NBP2 Protein involved in the HOG (high osmolarity glycerol) pathway [Maudiozyma saulgeensis]|uniref:Similar to Saccharomyces cerevisiae YDR162C NBP2 Protein involved in the HOG (High osmolarity glycerol) pathway n=1 Tax=Maudiozyma saulgeensis TaxID=1789683 RepID=A0A1X7R612_9SACH|nr:similar to Saccharomyces cerevisiae YDR162C NBP2 Protein involved in the HOG (high osmolarity glycerol) pathway [Kazachstania saulgeensis]